MVVNSRDVHEIVRNELLRFWKEVATPDIERYVDRIEESIQGSYQGWTPKGRKHELQVLIAAAPSEKSLPKKSPRASPRTSPRTGGEDEVIYYSMDKRLPREAGGHPHTPLTNDVDPRPLMLVANSPRVGVPQPSRCIADWCAGVSKFVQGNSFDIVVGSLVMINALSVGLQINLWATGWTAAELSQFDTLNTVMNLFFYVEILLRAYAYHPTFGKYVQRNILDTGVIAFLFVADVLGAARHTYGWTSNTLNPQAFGVVRMVRNFRLLRILRDPTILRWTRRFRVIVASFEDSLPSLACAILFIFVMNYILAVLLTASVVGLDMHPVTEHHSDVALLFKFFGTVLAATLTLWELTLDGYVCGIHWGQLLQIFYQNRPIWTPVLFIFYITLTKLGLLTIITGIFTATAMKVVEEDNRFIIQDFVTALVGALDEDGDGVITWEELNQQLDHPIILEFFPDLSKNHEVAHRIFSKMDVDGSGSCSIEELCQELAVRIKM